MDRWAACAANEDCLFLAQKGVQTKEGLMISLSVIGGPGKWDFCVAVFDHSSTKPRFLIFTIKREKAGPAEEITVRIDSATRKDADGYVWEIAGEIQPQGDRKSRRFVGHYSLKHHTGEFHYSQTLRNFGELQPGDCFRHPHTGDLRMTKLSYVVAAVFPVDETSSAAYLPGSQWNTVDERGNFWSWKSQDPVFLLGK